jgi:uncharacterized protein (TIGR03000 family)
VSSWDEDPGQDSPGELDSVPSTAAGASRLRRSERVQFVVTLPSDATLWAMGKKTTATGPVRRFRSPPLEAGSQYAYDFRARWTANGRTMTQKQRVVFSPGRPVEVHFPVQPRKAHPAPSQGRVRGLGRPKP